MAKLERGYIVEGRYRLETLLGEGGYGAVWQAVQLNVNRPVAIKFLKALTSDLSATKRFEREARALGRLQHPNCVTMLDYGHGEAGAYLVTEFLDGERLDHWAEGDHDLSAIFTVVFQILAALDHAHQQRIVHRDLKPANVVVSRNAAGELVVKVLDFGIASVVGAKRGDITKTGEVFGTPGYMAPEQLLGDNNVGPSADLYSLGVVLYQLIERRKLFTAGSGIEVALKHLTHAPPPMERPLPDGLQDVVFRLLAKQPGERFQSAEEVSRALQRVGSSEFAAYDAPPPSFAPGAMPNNVPTPPTSPTGYSRAGVSSSGENPMGHGPTGYSSGVGSTSGVRVRPPPPPTEPGAHHNLLLVAGGLIVIVGALAVIAHQFWGEESGLEKSGTTVEKSNVGNLLRREHLEVEPIGSRVKIEPVEGSEPEKAVRPPTSIGCGGADYEPGFQSVSAMLGPLEERRVFVYVPRGYTPDKPHRVLLALHDTGQAAGVMFDEFNFGPSADRDQVVIVFPEISHVFFTWKDPAEWDIAQADLEAARSVLCLENDRVMLFGFGSGGHAAQKLACRLDGVSAMVQSTYRKLKEDFLCDHPKMPYLFLAPMKDGRDPPEGGPGCMGGDDVVSVDRHESIYRELYGCEGSARVEYRHRGSVCQTWDCEAPFVSCRIDGGRPLPRQQGFRLSDCEGAPADFPYRDRVWEFLLAATPSDAKE